MSKAIDKEIKSMTYEDAVEELKAIVLNLESNEIPLDTAVEMFKRGISLSAYCNKKLSDAQGVIRILSKDKEGLLKETPFNPGDEETL